MNDERAAERHKLIAALLGPPGPELTCEECFEALDRYVELKLDERDADRAVPGMRAHLVGCPACGEDYDSLLAYVAAAQPRPPLGASET